MTVTSKLQANAERNKEIEKRQKREEKAASVGGAVRGSVPEREKVGFIDNTAMRARRRAACRFFFVFFSALLRDL